MKRNSMMVLAFVLGMVCPGMGQTYEAEKAFLDKQFKSGAIDVPTTQKLIRQLDVLNDDGFFDVIPYDTVTQAFTLRQTIAAPGMMRRDIFKRILEWASMMYSTDSEAITYQDEERGKIVVKAYLPITFNEQTTGLFGKRNTLRNARLWSTLMITVKDGKYKMEYYAFVIKLDDVFTDLGQQYSVNLIFVESLFPITDTIYADTMVTRARLLRTIFQRMVWQHKGLETYVRAPDLDYGF